LHLRRSRQKHTGRAETLPFSCDIPHHQNKETKNTGAPFAPDVPALSLSLLWLHGGGCVVAVVAWWLWWLCGGGGCVAWWSWWTLRCVVVVVGRGLMPRHWKFWSGPGLLWKVM
jgi:hypothetical protein